MALARAAGRARVAAHPEPTTAREMPSGRAAPLDVDVLVPARNEASVISGIIGDLGRQDALRDPDLRVRIHVIDDASDDGTGAVAAAAIETASLGDRARVIRHDGSTTKAAALAAAMPEVAGEGGWIVAFDADARIEPDAVGRLCREAEASGRAGANSGRAGANSGRAAATARRRMLTPPPGSSSTARLLAALQDDEQTVDLEMRSARWLLAGTGELRGNGVAIPTSALAAIGGWPLDAVAEDLDVSTALRADAGIAIRPCRQVVVWEQPAVTIGDLVRQRMRWAEGAIRRDLGVVAPRLGDAGVPLRVRVDLALYAAQTTLGLVAAGLLAGSMSSRRRGLPSMPLIAIATGYGAAILVMAFHALDRLDRSVAVVAFGSAWPVVTALAWARVAVASGPTRFDRTPKTAGFSPPWEPSEAPG
jgi:glycosyltransferase involved in cell wall biosynthesis